MNEKLSSNSIDGFLQYENIFTNSWKYVFLMNFETEIHEFRRRCMKTLSYHL